MAPTLLLLLPFVGNHVSQVINAATPGYAILDLLHNGLHDTLPVDLEVDLVIVDYGVNDAVIEVFDFDINNVKLAHELFILHVRNDMIDMPALLYAESFISPARVSAAPRQKSNMAEVHAGVTRKYDIPMVSQKIESCAGDLLIDGLVCLYARRVRETILDASRYR